MTPSGPTAVESPASSVSSVPVSPTCLAATHSVRNAQSPACLNLVSAQRRPLRGPPAAAGALFSALMYGFISLAMSGRIAGERERGREVMLHAVPTPVEFMLT
jgi:hypothetical protein